MASIPCCCKKSFCEGLQTDHTHVIFPENSSQSRQQEKGWGLGSFPPPLNKPTCLSEKEVYRNALHEVVSYIEASMAEGMARCGVVMPTLIDIVDAYNPPYDAINSGTRNHGINGTIRRGGWENILILVSKCLIEKLLINFKFLKKLF